jgi:hypothetical protein
LKEEIKGVLGDISYNDIKRFEFVEKEGNILIKYDLRKKEKDLVLANSYLVPVGHVYWIEDSLYLRKGKLSM